MTHCYVFNKYGNIYHIDDPEQNRSATRRALDMCDGEPSTVGINGKEVCRPDLRQSISIRNKFACSHPSLFFLKQLFEEYKVGIGSKHIYGTGCYMKPHRDTRLPDMDGLPHVMTMVVINLLNCVGGRLLINGKDIRRHYTYTVLFSLDCLHEVTPVISGTRQSFAFPVYGRYKSIEHIKNDLTIRPKTIYELVMEHIEQYDKNRNATDALAKLQGAIEILNDENLSRYIVRYRLRRNEFVPYGKLHDEREDIDDTVEQIKIRYTLSGKNIKLFISKPYTIPDGSTNIIINGEEDEDDRNERDSEFVENLRTRVKILQENFLSEKINISEPVDYEQIKNIPTSRFVVLLSGTYFHDSTIDDLIPKDKWLYAQLSEHQRQVVFTTGLKHSWLPVYKWNSSRGTLEDVEDNEYDDVKVAVQLDVEFDDQCGYDPTYERVYGLLIVE